MIIAKALEKIFSMVLINEEDVTTSVICVVSKYIEINSNIHMPRVRKKIKNMISDLLIFILLYVSFRL